MIGLNKLFKIYTIYIFYMKVINNKHRNITITKLPNKYLTKDIINRLYIIYNNCDNNKLSNENIKYINNITDLYDVTQLYDNYIIIKDAIIYNNNDYNEFFCMYFTNKTVDIYIISGKIDIIDNMKKFEDILEMSTN